MKNPTVPNTPKRAIFYARVSSEGQVDNTSIDTQLDRGRAYAISQGWTLDRIFIDGGESGKSTDRTHFQEMVSYIQENPVDVLLTFKLDRLSRNLKDLLIFIDDTLDPKGIALQSVTENFNTQSAEGRLFLQMLGSFAEFERKRINERTMSGKVSTAKKGGWNGGKVPYGYQRIEGSQFDFDIQPEEAKVVEQVFRLRSQGTGYGKIQQITGCPLSRQGIKNMIGNPFYCGKIRFGGIVESNNHQGIVSERLFNKCQNVIESK
ncbi:MAG: site-specific recombinase [Candidatus Poribacteria bacterium]|nr:site-specific recombinase [Candidatus Poribacteria bacterium]